MRFSRADWESGRARKGGEVQLASCDLSTGEVRRRTMPFHPHFNLVLLRQQRQRTLRAIGGYMDVQPRLAIVRGLQLAQLDHEAAELWALTQR